MALQVILTTTSAKSCTSIFIEDTTGSYNAESNPTAYGAPNPTTGDVTSTIVKFTDRNGNIYTYSDYLPTQGKVELTLADFVLTAGVTPEDATGCGCAGTADTDTFSIENAFCDGCWSIQYTVYQDDDILSEYSEGQFFSCVTARRIIASTKTAACGACEAEVSEAVWTARQYYEDAQIVYQHGGCECAQNLLTKANEILFDVENGNIV